MRVENHIGSLTVISGPVKSGKSERALSINRRMPIAKKNVQLFQHSLGTTDVDGFLKSNDGNVAPAELFNTLADLNRLIKPDTDIAIITSVHLIGEKPKVTIDTMRNFMRRGIDLFTLGLDMNSEGDYYEQTAALMAIAQTVIKLNAVCVECGSNFAYLSRNETNGSATSYDPVCAQHHELFIEGPHGEIYFS